MPPPDPTLPTLQEALAADPRLSDYLRLLEAAAFPDDFDFLAQYTLFAPTNDALDAAGIDASTPDPPGGRIVRGADGEPTGLLREKAYDLALDAYDSAVAQRTPEEIEASAERELLLASAEPRARSSSSVARSEIAGRAAEAEAKNVLRAEALERLIDRRLVLGYLADPVVNPDQAQADALAIASYFGIQLADEVAQFGNPNTVTASASPKLSAWLNLPELVATPIGNSSSLNPMRLDRGSSPA